MEKNSTLSEQKVSDSRFSDNKQEQINLQPSTKTIRNIMQFAATYRSEKISENRFIQIHLN